MTEYLDTIITAAGVLIMLLITIVGYFLNQVNVMFKNKVKNDTIAFKEINDKLHEIGLKYAILENKFDNLATKVNELHDR